MAFEVVVVEFDIRDKCLNTREPAKLLIVPSLPACRVVKLPASSESPVHCFSEVVCRAGFDQDGHFVRQVARKFTTSWRRRTTDGRRTVFDGRRDLFVTARAATRFERALLAHYDRPEWPWRVIDDAAWRDWVSHTSNRTSLALGLPRPTSDHRICWPHTHVTNHPPNQPKTQLQRVSQSSALSAAAAEVFLREEID